MNKKITNIVDRMRMLISGSDWMEPLSNSIIREFGHNTYLILISCLISLRAQDRVTIYVCRDLFDRVCTPEQMCDISQEELERIIYKSGYYKTKARTLKSVSRELLYRFDGNVPQSEENLLSIKGVGRKTANLVRGMAFGIPAICVDIHVHRISNRLGLVTTKTPEDTEKSLEQLLPKELWIEWNYLLVIWGQNLCAPQSPKCSNCPLFKDNVCKRAGVGKSR